jgi:chromatin remodeling complex protein RSC6
MVRASAKSVSSTHIVAEPVVEAVEPVVDDVVHKAKKSKKTKTTEIVEVIEVAPVVEAPAPVKVEEPAVETADADITDVAVPDVPFSGTLVKVAEFEKRLNDLTVGLSSAKLEYKALVKGLTKEIKNAQKHLSKGKRSGVKRTSTVFVKPTLISDELAHFLGKEPGTEIGRSAASKEVHNYIKANQLNKGRTIHPDPVLAKILNYTEGVSPVLTYLNLQTFLKHNFIGNKTPVVV